MTTQPAQVNESDFIKEAQDVYMDPTMDKSSLAKESPNDSGHGIPLVYPAALAAMSGAPSMETLQQGLDLEAKEREIPLWTALRKEWRLLFCCVPYFLLACSAGFDQGANNITTSMPAFLFKFGYFNPVAHTLSVDSKWISLWPACLFIGYLVGSASCSYLLERFGPRKVATAAAVYINGPIILQAFSTTPEMLAVGKLLSGIGIGLFQTTAGNFTAESSPQKLRAMLTSSIGMALILGLVFGIAAGAAVITDLREWHSFRLVLVLQSVIPVVSLALLPFSVTSPVYLIKRNKPEEAAKVVGKTSGIKDEQLLRAKVAVIQYGVAVELEERASHGQVTFWDVVRDRVDRRRTLLAVGVFVATQAAGTAFLGQGLYFLVQQGVDITTATNITLGCLTISAVAFPLASILANRFGRRFCFVYMSIVHLVVMAVIGFLGFRKGDRGAGWALAVLVNIGITTQSLSTAAVVYTLVAEIPSLRLRAKTQSIAFTVNNFFSLATTLVVPYVFQSPGYLGAKTALIFCGTLICAIVWAFFYVPETNRRSPTELDALFAAKVPARQFATTDISTLSATHTLGSNGQV